jgi:hypothetical protein
MDVDPAFRNYFENNIKQILICITDQCNLQREHCYYKITLAHREMDFAVNDN